MENQLITAAIGVGILGAAYLIDLWFGFLKVIFTPDMKWQWKKWLQDFVKAIMLATGLLGFVAVLNALMWYGETIGADLSYLDGVSFGGLIGIVVGGCIWYMSGAYKNIKLFIKGKSVAVDERKLIEGGEVIRELVDAWWSEAFTTEEVAKAQDKFEEEGGRGFSYSVPIGTYDEFRNAVLGKGYDIDGAYGAQCWDGAALLWQQLGQSLLTGGNNAKGTWLNMRDVNANPHFDLITNSADLKRGDVIVYGYGQFGHIAFVDNVSPLRLLGQNQTGTGNGAPFNIINANLSGFLGAFRLKKWIVKTPEVPPTPPAPVTPADVVEYTYKKGDTFGQVILNLGLQTSHGLWGAGGDVEYYTAQLREQGITGNIPVGKTITLRRRK